MKIAIFDIEPKINNTALMKISQYHKDMGDRVEWYIDWNRNQYDKIYCSSLFNFTSKSLVPEGAICGGTGFDIKSRLPEEIEECDLDYSIYPNCDVSYIWFSRGCFRDCPFCIVREKEGFIHSVKPTNLNPKGKTIDIMDNNFFGNPEWENAISFLEKWKLPINFRSGIDIRIFKPEHADFINKYRIKKVHCAWDNPEDDLYPQLKEVIKYIPAYKLMCYVLIGYDSTPEQDLSRVMKIRELKIDPFVMPFNKKDKYQMKFARWVNMKAIFKTVKWEEYNA
jgi:hypothetical protein